MLVHEVGRVKGVFVYEVALGGVFGGYLRVSAVNNNTIIF